MFNEFKNKYLGKTVDVDGAFGGQCVDLFNAWNRDYNGCYINCAPTGYARSLAENKENNGILNYYKETSINNMIEGTVVVYGICEFAPVGHVGFFIEDNGNGTFKCLQQNYNNQQVVTINNNPYDGIIGAFIPNQILEERKPKEPENYLKYRGQCEDYGWLEWVENGEICGTTGESKRLEAIQIDSNIPIKAKAHIQDIGWIDYGTINKDTVIGTVGEWRRLECLCLEGNFKYRVHIQDTGWTNWTTADGITTMGTVGQSLRMEAIEIVKL